MSMSSMNNCDWSELKRLFHNLRECGCDGCLGLDTWIPEFPHFNSVKRKNKYYKKMWLIRVSLTANSTVSDTVKMIQKIRSRKWDHDLNEEIRSIAPFSSRYKERKWVEECETL